MASSPPREFLRAVSSQRTHWQIWTLNTQILASQAERETFQRKIKHSLYCDCCYSSLATEETQEYKERGCMVMVTDTSASLFSTPLSNVFPKPAIHFLTVTSHLLVPVPLCTIIPHQLPEISVSLWDSVPLHSSQTNSPSMISEENALKKKFLKKGKQSPWT